METIQRAIIIAAGQGNRLHPVTLEIPKPLVKVNGVRMIDTSIQALKHNGIREIYIVAGYKKEKFFEAYASDPMVHIIENPCFNKGNNITSLYYAREYLENSFIIEGDLIIRDEAVFRPEIEQSAYCAAWKSTVPEWALEVENRQIISCNISGSTNTYQLFGISMWTEEDGRKLRTLLEERIEEIKDWSIYWDQIPLFLNKDSFHLGIREISDNALEEIDTFEELCQRDQSYLTYTA